MHNPRRLSRHGIPFAMRATNSLPIAGTPFPVSLGVFGRGGGCVSVGEEFAGNGVKVEGTGGSWGLVGWVGGCLDARGEEREANGYLI